MNGSTFAAGEIHHPLFCLKRIWWIIFPLLLLLITRPAASRGQTVVVLVDFTASAESPNIRLAWETATELDTAGFYVVRSLEQNGSYVRMNSEMIPAEGDSMIGANYSFLDTNVNPTQVYYYQLEVMNTTGGAEYFGPVWAGLQVSTATPTSSPTPTRTVTPTATEEGAPAVTGTSTTTLTATTTPTATGEASGEPSATATHAPTMTRTPSPIPTRTWTPVPPATSIPTLPTSAPSATRTATATLTPTPTSTPTLNPLSTVDQLFPPVSPTVTRTSFPHPTHIPPVPTATLSRQTGPGVVSIMGGIIFLAWLILGAALVIYLRRMGY